jgi:hypothetical protein
MSGLYGLVKLAWNSWTEYTEREALLRETAEKIARENNLSPEQTGELINVTRERIIREQREQEAASEGSFGEGCLFVIVLVATFCVVSTVIGYWLDHR